MRDEIDSRNAAIKRKRTASPDEGGSEVLASRRPRTSDSPDSPQSARFTSWNQNIRTQIRPSLGRPRLSSNKTTATTAADRLKPSERELQASGTSDAPYTVPDTNQAVLKARANVEPVVNPAASNDEDSSSEEGEIQSAFSGDDEAVVINVADGDDYQGRESSMESGEISDDDMPPAPGFDGADDSDTQDMDVSDTEPPEDTFESQRRATRQPDVEIIDLMSDDGSRMLHPPGRSTNGSNGDLVYKPASKTVTLADLDHDDLVLQLRYYYIGQNPENVPISTPARCLSCAGLGHVSESCPELTCRHCKAYNKHFSDSCTSIVQCAKCGTPGHETSTCPSQLRATKDDLLCTLCKCRQHTAPDCESRWRTSEFPPPAALRPRELRLYCYECGHAGHLGNDCPSRNSHKPMGTSMWSEHTRPGGTIPACTSSRVIAPLPPSRRQREMQRRREREEMNAEPVSHDLLVGARRAAPAGPKGQGQGPTKIKFGNVANGRPDLTNPQKGINKATASRGGAKAAAGATSQPQNTTTFEPKRKRQRSKPKKSGPVPVRPNAGAAKKAFMKGKN